MIPIARIALVAVWLCTFGVTASGQGPGEGFEIQDVQLLEVPGREPVLKYLRGQIVDIKGGVHMKLYAADPDQAPITIRAEDAFFEYADDGSIERLELHQNVSITMPDGSITAAKAVLSMRSMALVFTGSPVLEMEGSPTRAKRIEYNLETGEALITGPVTPRFSISSIGGNKGEDRKKPVLAAADIEDWPGFLTKLKAQAAADAPSPGRRIFGLLDVDVRKQLDSFFADKEPSSEDKAGIVKMLNRVLAKPDLYDKDSWDCIGLTAEAAAMLKRGPEKLEEKQLLRLNRLLFDAAFKESVAGSST